MIPFDIISAVRERLGDSKTERWTDETLLLYVSMCQSDICMNAHLYRKTVTIQLNNTTKIYPLPLDYLALNRLELEGKLFPVESRNTIDSGDATLPCGLKDNLMYNELEIVLDPNSEDPLVTNLVNVYGVSVYSSQMDCTLASTYGVVTSVDAVTPPVTTEATDLVVYYTAVPPKLLVGDLYNPLIVPDIWFGAFLHFVCGMALQDDNDANNIQRGELEAGKYVRLLAHIMKTTAKDFTSNMKTKLTTKVRRI